MPALHTPERAEGETLADYRERRKLSKLTTQAQRLVGPFAIDRSTPSSRAKFRADMRRQNPERWRARVTHSQGLAEWASRRAAATSRRRGAK